MHDRIAESRLQSTTRGHNEALLELLDSTLSGIYELYQLVDDPGMQIYEAWTARDILVHITFWHESFARNVSDLAAGKKPSPLKGTYRALNQRGNDEMAGLSIAEIIEKLRSAQRIIQENISSKKVKMIPYRVGSRDYSPEEHLEVVQEHIAAHKSEVDKAWRAKQKAKPR